MTAAGAPVIATLRAALAAFLVVAVTSCASPPSAAEKAQDEHRDAIAQLPEFTRTPPGATLLEERRLEGCWDSGSGPSVPSVHRNYKIPRAKLQRSVRELRDRWERAGWAPAYGGNMPRYFAYQKQTASGRSDSLSVFVASPELISVTGEPVAEPACEDSLF